MCRSPGQNNCLTYYTPSQIPALTAFASKYVVSDHTFSMHDSPSWGGHMWPVAATQDGFTGDIPYGVDGDTGWGCDAEAVANWISPQGVELVAAVVHPGAGGLPQRREVSVRRRVRADAGAERAHDLRPSRRQAPAVEDLRHDLRSGRSARRSPKCLYGPQHNNVVRDRAGPHRRQERHAARRTRWCCPIGPAAVPVSIRRRRCSSATTGSARS